VGVTTKTMATNIRSADHSWVSYLTEITNNRQSQQDYDGLFSQFTGIPNIRYA